MFDCFLCYFKWSSERIADLCDYPVAFTFWEKDKRDVTASHNSEAYYKYPQANGKNKVPILDNIF